MDLTRLCHLKRQHIFTYMKYLKKRSKVANLIKYSQKWVTFHSFLPFLYIFFLSRIWSQIEEKYTKFHKTLGVNYESKYSLLNLFIESGLSPEDLKRKCINYEMTEKVVVEQINSQSSNMIFEDIDIILNKIKTEMKVDFASSIETEK